MRTISTIQIPLEFLGTANCNVKLDEYAKELAEDLKKAKKMQLILDRYFEEGFPTLPDTDSREKDGATMLTGKDLVEAEGSSVSDRYDGLSKEPKDRDKDKGDTGSEADKDESEAVEGLYEDREDKSEDNDEGNGDLKNEDDNDDRSEDDNSENEL
ncbi:hypothetical protein EV426DRAFT_579169 [Tirmania nivea]|nr:hypothetical protein EV426DRAFT_579169 [Tirmania nivea]